MVTGNVAQDVNTVLLRGRMLFLDVVASLSVPLYPCTID